MLVITYLILSNLFEVLTQSYPKAAFPTIEHLCCHQRVEDSSANERYTEVAAKQPPVLSLHVELERKARVMK